jgi:vancomycin resistance protein YoaR
MTSESLPLDPGALGGANVATPGSPWLRLFVAFVGSAVAGAVLLLALLVGIQAAYAGRALPGVNVAGFDIAGMTRDAAAASLEAALPSLTNGTLSLVVGNETLPLRYGDLGREYDTDAMLDAAFAVGRSGDPLARGLEELRTLVRGNQIAPRVQWNEAMLATALTAAAKGFDREPLDATVTRAENGHFLVSEASYGRRLDPTAALAEMRDILADPAAPAASTVKVSVEPIMPRVLTAQAEYARSRAELLASLKLTAVSGKDKWTILAKEVRTWISFRAGTYGGLQVELVGPPMAKSLAALAKKVARDPKDAAFLTGKSGLIVGVVKGVNGRTLDVVGSMTAIAAAYETYGEDPLPAPTVELAVTVVKPKLTTEEANKVAPLMTRLSTWTTYYPPGEGNYFGKNISIPAKIISGTVVPNGSWFSFWDTVGIPTAAQGYGPGGVIVNGRSDPTGAFAGGICSCSTTLFNAAIRAGLPFGKRDNHYYYIPRYPLGLDATVWMYSWTSRQDMTFRNDTGHPILIRSLNSYGVVRFDIYGVPDGRRTTFSKPTIKNVVKSHDTTVKTTAIPVGTTKRVEFPHDGMDVWVTRTVTRNGVVIHRETIYSDYKVVNGELWVGVAPSGPAATPTPSPSASSTTTVWA